jgi:hypothetical protein
MIRKLLNHRQQFLLFTLLICFVITSCKPQQEQPVSSTYADSAATTATTLEENIEDGSQSISSENYEIIDYVGIEDIERNKAQSFKPFVTLSALVQSYIWKKGGANSDTAALDEEQTLIYRQIVNYKKEIESGHFDLDRPPALLELTRHSSFTKLSAPGKNSFFNSAKFFFLGGAPFIKKVIGYDSITGQEQTFTDSKGKPEFHFQVFTENSDFLLKSIMYFKKPKVEVIFGGPIPAYDGPADEVNGIGSIVHQFNENIPVIFLTENGLISARLIYCDLAMTQQSSCYSSYPRIVFACNDLIEDTDILAVYIPYDNVMPSTCNVTREHQWLWTADLNGDNTADLACAIGTMDGISDDFLVEVLWFVNVDGEWKIIDYGSEPSCT